MKDEDKNSSVIITKNNLKLLNALTTWVSFFFMYTL